MNLLHTTCLLALVLFSEARKLNWDGGCAACIANCIREKERNSSYVCDCCVNRKRDPKCFGEKYHPYNCADGTTDPACGGLYFRPDKDDAMKLENVVLKFKPVNNTFVLSYDTIQEFPVNPKNSNLISYFEKTSHYDDGVYQGSPIDLPFEFPFMGFYYDIIYPDKKGQVLFVDQIYHKNILGKDYWWGVSADSFNSIPRISVLSLKETKGVDKVSWKLSWNKKKVAVTFENQRIDSPWGYSSYGWHTAPPNNFQIVLHETGEIWLAYLDMGLYEACTARPSRPKNCPLSILQS